MASDLSPQGFVWAVKRNLAWRSRVRRFRRYLAGIALNGVDREVDQLAHVVAALSADGLPLPPPGLRMHIGATESAANFPMKGLGSSQKVVDVFGESPPGPVLDWGCGSGRVLRWLRHYPGWRENYFGCDVDGGAICWLAEQGVERVRTSQDAPPLPYEAGSFHGLFGISVLTHIRPELHRGWYEEFRRLLVPGGIVLMTFHGRTALRNPLFPSKTCKSFADSGHAFYEHPGHYKDAAFVDEAFTRRAVNGLFEVESFDEGLQDAARLRAV